MYFVLGVIFILGVFVLLLNTSGGFSLLSGFFDNLGFETISEETRIAQNSFEALGCSLEAVLTGNDEVECLQDFQPREPAVLSGFGVVAQEESTTVPVYETLEQTSDVFCLASESGCAACTDTCQGKHNCISRYHNCGIPDFDTGDQLCDCTITYQTIQEGTGVSCSVVGERSVLGVVLFNDIMLEEEAQAICDASCDDIPDCVSELEEESITYDYVHATNAREIYADEFIIDLAEQQQNIQGTHSPPLPPGQSTLLQTYYDSQIDSVRAYCNQRYYSGFSVKNIIEMCLEKEILSFGDPGTLVITEVESGIASQPEIESHTGPQGERPTYATIKNDNSIFDPGGTGSACTCTVNTFIPEHLGVDEDDNIILIPAKTSSFSYDVYGFSNEEAQETCDGDLAALQTTDQSPDNPTREYTSVEYSCRSFPGSFKFNEKMPNSGQETISSFTCTTRQTVKDVACTVLNFQLPQDTTEAQEWIRGYGDPLYVVYFQSFPVGEDGWNRQAEWWWNAVDIAFAWWGGGKLFSIAGKWVLVKPLGWGLSLSSKGFSKVGGIFTTRTASEATQEAAEIAAKDRAVLLRETILSDSAISLATRRALAEELETLGKEVIESSVKASASVAEREARQGIKLIPDFVKKRAKAFGIGVAGGTVAAGTAGLAFAAWIDSINQKFIPVKNSLLLKMPYVEPEALELTIDGSPVFVTQLDDINRDVPLYLASPCKADLFIRNHVVTCDGGYRYNSLSGQVECTDPDIERFDENGPDLGYSGQLCKPELKVSNNFDRELILPRKIDAINTEDDLLLWERDPGTISIHEPATKMTFTFRLIDYEPDNGGRNYELERVQFGSKSWTIVNGQYEGDDLRMTFDEYSCYGPGNRLIGECLIDFDEIEIFDTACDDCTEFERNWNYLEVQFESIFRFGLVDLVFSWETEEIEEPDGETEEFSFWQLRYHFSQGDYQVYFRDVGGTPPQENTPDGYVDSIGIATESSIWEDVFGLDFEDSVILSDTDLDHSFDSIQIPSCSVIGPAVEVHRTESDERNFCLHAESTGEKIVAWSPVIGAGIGTVVGGALGILGGPFAEVTVPGGAMAGGKIGGWIGAGVYTTYIFFKKIAGTSSEWPGPTI